MTSLPNEIELKEVQPTMAAGSSRRHDGSSSQFMSGKVRFVYDVSTSEDVSFPEGGEYNHDNKYYEFI